MSWEEIRKKLEPAPSVPYQKMYTTLFNAVTDALRLLEKGNSAGAAALLKQAQQSTEEQYINAGESSSPQSD